MHFGKLLLTTTLLFASGFSATAINARDMLDFGHIGNSASKQQHPGMVVWRDLLTRDVRVAADFYRDVFGWRFDFSADGDYAYATLDGAPIASIVRYDDDVNEAEGLWLISIAVADVDAAVRQVGSGGGEVLQAAEDLPGRGRYALISDPSGAVSMLLRADGGDPDVVSAANRWLWAELWTDDVAAATRFYETVFGYRSASVNDGTGGAYMVLGRDRSPYASVVRIPLPDVEPNWLSYMLVEDVDATARSVLRAGGSVLLPPQKDELNQDVAIVADPTGGVFALQQKEADK